MFYLFVLFLIFYIVSFAWESVSHIFLKYLEMVCLKKMVDSI